MEFIALRVGKIPITVSFQRWHNHFLGLLFSRRAMCEVLAECLHQNHMGYLFKLQKLWLSPSPFGWGLGISHLVNSLGAHIH